MGKETRGKRSCRAKKEGSLFLNLWDFLGIQKGGAMASWNDPSA
ncbi:Hypothetical protein Minf_0781 [Methylacidiphilum infernorum V4]|uniref:Uncharacterized protein n=1 Tax=Methylacidiphilum infernorum (isolate V4) TaxID=481448 RepID=B3E0T2_METI4|nr:Hypothetical protein Minf_0781 [Methylacidiphilum infernorum V4]